MRFMIYAIAVVFICTLGTRMNGSLAADAPAMSYKSAVDAKTGAKRILRQNTCTVADCETSCRDEQCIDFCSTSTCQTSGTCGRLRNVIRSCIAHCRPHPMCPG